MNATRHSWDQLLELARELKRWSSCSVCEETRQRSATSRAYYAAFCSARNYLRDFESDIPPTNGKVHKWVRDRLDTPKGAMDKERAEVAAWLKRLHLRRKRADYEDTIGPRDTAASDCVYALIESRKVINLLASLEKGIVSGSGSRSSTPRTP